MIEEKKSIPDRLYGLLGDLPPKNRSVRVIDCRTEIKPDRIIEHLRLDLNPFEAVSAVFVKPRTGTARFPCVLYNHSHGGFFDLGKNELIKGVEYQCDKPYADSLIENGYSALSIDHWCFGNRQDNNQSALSKEMLWKGCTLWGLMIYDSIKALDYLVAREDVMTDRIGTLGMSMGSTMAWWLAALDSRIKVCVDICCLTDFHELIKTGGLDGHGIYYYVPALLKEFTTAAINKLICPRPHLALAGRYDPLTPVKGLDRIDRELERAYAEADASSAWQLEIYEVGHEETREMRKCAMDFLNKYL